MELILTKVAGECLRSHSYSMKKATILTISRKAFLRQETSFKILWS